MHFIKHQPGAFVWNKQIIEFPAKMWKNIKYEIKETLQKYFGAKLLNQIDKVVIIQTKFGTN